MVRPVYRVYIEVVTTEELATTQRVENRLLHLSGGIRHKSSVVQQRRAAQET